MEEGEREKGAQETKESKMHHTHGWWHYHPYSQAFTPQEKGQQMEDRESFPHCDQEGKPVAWLRLERRKMK